MFQLIHTALDLGDKIDFLEKIEKSQYPALELILDHVTSSPATGNEERLVETEEIEKLAIEAFNHLDKNFFQVFLERGQYYLLTLAQSTRTREKDLSNKTLVVFESAKSDNDAEFLAIKTSEKRILLFPNLFSPYYQQLYWLYEYENLGVFQYSGNGSIVQLQKTACVEYREQKWYLVESGRCLLISPVENTESNIRDVAQEEEINISIIHKLQPSIDAFNCLDKDFFEKKQNLFLALPSPAKNDNLNLLSERKRIFESSSDRIKSEFFIIEFDSKYFLFPNIFSPYYRDFSWLYKERKTTWLYDKSDIFQYEEDISSVSVLRSCILA